jgi:hypothetical protein
VKSTITAQALLTASIATCDKRSLIHTSVMEAINTSDNIPKTVNICIRFFDALNTEAHNVVILDRLATLAAPREVMLIFVPMIVLEPVVPETFYGVNLLI